MKRLLIFAFAITLAGWSCESSDVGEVEREDQQNVALIKIYRDECFKELDDKGRTLDALVSSMPDITKEQAQNLGRAAGIVDEQGYVVDRDIWVKECVDKKLEVNK